MKLLRDPLEAITAADIQQLCADQVSESTEFELKSELPSKAGQQSDPWYEGKAVGEYARNQIAEEVIAFANTLGGVVCVGIEESSDDPRRAVSPMPIPRVHELARRLRQSVYDIIDPPLPILEAVGIELSELGEGVVLLRVPPSRRRPHRSQVNKEVFVRRADESVRVSMREIQELTLQAVAEAEKTEALITEFQTQFRAQLRPWLRAGWGCGLHLVAAPTAPLDLGRVSGRPTLTSSTLSVVAEIGGNRHQCAWPFAPNDYWRPGLRSITAVNERTDRLVSYLIRTDGVCELAFNVRASEERPGVFAGWLLGGLGCMLALIERVRREASSNVEYALAAQISVSARPVQVMRYGAGGFSGFDEGESIAPGDHVFPTMSIGPPDEFSAHLSRFDEDVWNLAGQDFQKQPIKFILAGH